MKVIELNDWMLINNIIYKIYTTEDEAEMRRTFLEQLKMLIDFDAADFFLASDGDSFGLQSPVLYNCDGISSDNYDEIDYSRGIMYSGKCMVYRETDIISDETRVETEYYKRVYKPNNWHFSVQMIFAYEKKFVGAATLYRNIGKENFKYDDILLMDMLKEHIAYRLYKNSLPSSAVSSADALKKAEEYGLTRRETDVLIHILNGEDNSEISERLVISVHTLKKHILNIYRKTDVNSRIQLMNRFK